MYIFNCALIKWLNIYLPNQQNASNMPACPLCCVLIKLCFCQHDVPAQSDSRNVAETMPM